MKYALIILILITGISDQILLAQSSTGYASNTVIFKVKSEFRTLCKVDGIQSSKLESIVKNLESAELKKIFPRHEPPRSAYNSDGILLADLSLIYVLTYEGSTPIYKLISAISNLEIIEYAQLKSIPKPLYVPNDDSSNLVSQYHLSNIQAYAAWDITKGDSTVVIGITDSGMDTSHVDMVGNMAYNLNDPIDGVDNDNDGFVDNYRGWDMGDNDLDPSSTGIWAHHGTTVAGLAAATTDNGINGAGVGFNTKFLPVKISQDSDGDFVAAYEGIVYAADHGCDIINCSWGGTDPVGQFEQDVINYATLTMDALVVAAAGNSNDASVYYPASLKYVMSVGGTNSDDEKYIITPTSGSTFGRNLDLCAPGAYIYTSKAGGGFGLVNSGTSYAAPILSGCAALVKSQFPNYSAIQIGEQLKVTADNIDTILGNSLYPEKLGSGRVNVYSAVSDSSKPSIVMIKRFFSDGNDERFVTGDTIKITGTFKNYLATTTGLGVFVQLSCTNSDVTIIQSTVNLGNINSLDTVGNYTDPMTFTLKPTIGISESIELRLQFTNGSYSAYEYVSIFVNPEPIIDVTTNNISTSITNKGRIGYTDHLPLEGRSGLGFVYNGNQLIFEAGFMVGAQIGSTTHVSDNTWDFTAPDADMVNVLPASIVSSTVADFEVNCVFNDNGAGADSMKITVDQSVYAWTNAPDDDFVMLEYRIINKGSDTLMNLFAGVNADWDILHFDRNRASGDIGTRMGYAFSTEPSSPYAGIKLLSRGPFVHYAIDYYSGAPGLDIYYPNSFNTAKKYTALSTSRMSAGATGIGNDVIEVVSTGPFKLSPNDTVIVTFAMLVGDDLQDLATTANAAQAMYDSLYPEPADTTNTIVTLGQKLNIEIYPNPSTGVVTLVIDRRASEQTYFEVYDVTGALIYEHVHPIAIGSGAILSSEHDLSDLESGIYYFTIRSGSMESHGKLVLVQ